MPTAAGVRLLGSDIGNNNHVIEFLRAKAHRVCTNPLGDLRNGSAAASCHVLNKAPGAPLGEKAGDARIALCVLWTALVLALSLGLGLTLCLPSAPVVVVLAGHCSQHVQQHAVDGRTGKS